MKIKDGAAALDKGEFTEIEEADLDSYLEKLKGAPGKRAR